MQNRAFVFALSLAACSPGSPHGSDFVGGKADHGSDACQLPEDDFATLVDDGAFATFDHRTIDINTPLSALEEAQIVLGLQVKHLGKSAHEAIHELQESHVSAMTIEDDDGALYDVYEFEAGDNPNGFIFKSNSIEQVAIIGDGFLQCEHIPAGLQDCQFPMDIPMFSAGDSQDGDVVFDPATGKCDYTGGFMAQYAGEPTLFGLSFSQVLLEEEDVFATGEVNWGFGWRLVFSSEGGAMGFTHNLCELMPGTDILLHFDTNPAERDDGYEASAFVSVHFDPDIGAVTVNSIDVFEFTPPDPDAEPNPDL